MPIQAISLITTARPVGDGDGVTVGGTVGTPGVGVVAGVTDGDIDVCGVLGGAGVGALVESGVLLGFIAVGNGVGTLVALGAKDGDMVMSPGVIGDVTLALGAKDGDMVMSPGVIGDVTKLVNLVKGVLVARISVIPAFKLLSGELRIILLPSLKKPKKATAKPKIINILL
ncbi:MAG: hypothetical protein A3C81_01680 [Candidatus Yanofskybacteria bacterium RIFCSPHIGHO2_02_FULL_46_19]|uniref:Uncharacterized protein n=2 Tax=Candidatus Yanofskyibacteriota TaxID=1752733 RepID=A0A1F8H4E5_9BACT|nr:MAG: hypothetical protein A3C81_01680 [Candidatus Yanofskybacteria bacterium RIFCSPHIGHO2_02_FULL_46_19]OGN31826.1 MAG: hypothetical protein A3J01_00705 [Candidatus Yanofskybacteria bacterium RIFCSPLOWO2_02_FULL_45_18]